MHRHHLGPQDVAWQRLRFLGNRASLTCFLYVLHDAYTQERSLSATFGRLMYLGRCGGRLPFSRLS